MFVVVVVVVVVFWGFFVCFFFFFFFFLVQVLQPFMVLVRCFYARYTYMFVLALPYHFLSFFFQAAFKYRKKECMIHLQWVLTQLYC